MILDHVDDLDAFRAAIRQWLSDVVPTDWAEEQARNPDGYRDFQRWWMAERDKVGLATPHWPKEYGGANLSIRHQAILAEELARARAPDVMLFAVSLNHIPATLIPWGTEAQKREHLPGVSKGVIWCQGFSEPGAGSDLASLKTKAVRDGDHYVINGQKIWTSMSMFASHCILLARTSNQGRKQEGITYFLMDMATPGIEIRPIRQSNGHADFAEMFLTDVKIPAENMVGGEGEGWKVAQSTLASERGLLAFENLERMRYFHEGYFKQSLDAGKAWTRDPQMRREHVTLFAEMQAARRLARKVLREHEEGHTGFSLTPPLVKLNTTSSRQKYHDFRVRAEGVGAQSFDLTDHANPMQGYIASFGATISAGTNEIMRNIIAERGLGLPREPSPKAR